MDIITVVGHIVARADKQVVHFIEANEKSPAVAYFEVKSRPSYDPSPIETNGRKANRNFFRRVEYRGPGAEWARDNLKVGDPVTVVGEPIPAANEAQSPYMVEGEVRWRKHTVEGHIAAFRVQRQVRLDETPAQGGGEQKVATDATPPVPEGFVAS